MAVGLVGWSRWGEGLKSAASARPPPTLPFFPPPFPLSFGPSSLSSFPPPLLLLSIFPRTPAALSQSLRAECNERPLKARGA